MAKSKRQTEDDKCFYRGFAVAVGSLAREHDQPSVAVDIMDCNGVTLEDLKKAGVEEFDLKLLRKEWRGSLPMKTLLVLATLALLSVLPVHADTVDYTETVVNAPGGIGSFSWTIEHDGFIQPPPPLTFDSQGNCTDCLANLFTPIASSPPSNGDGCQITGVWMWPNFGPAPVTLFAPLCDGLYGGFSGGVLPDVGTLGTFNWQWENPDGSQNFITLSITDPASPVTTPEPHGWSLLLAGLGLVWLARKIKL